MGRNLRGIVLRQASVSSSARAEFGKGRGVQTGARPLLAFPHICISRRTVFVPARPLLEKCLATKPPDGIVRIRHPWKCATSSTPSDCPTYWSLGISTCGPGRQSKNGSTIENRACSFWWRKRGSFPNRWKSSTTRSTMAVSVGIFGFANALEGSSALHTGGNGGSSGEGTLLRTQPVPAGLIHCGSYHDGIRFPLTVWLSCESGMHQSDPQTTWLPSFCEIATRCFAFWREQVRELPSAKNLDTPTLNDHIPNLLEGRGRRPTVAGRRNDTGSPEGGQPACARPATGEGRFDIEEVVAEYNILRGCIHDLADANGLILQGAPFHIVNRYWTGLSVWPCGTTPCVRPWRCAPSRRISRIRGPRSAHAAECDFPLRPCLELTLSRTGNPAESSKMFTSLRRNVARLEELSAR